MPDLNRFLTMAEVNFEADAARPLAVNLSIAIDADGSRRERPGVAWLDFCIGMNLPLLSRRLGCVAGRRSSE